MFVMVDTLPGAVLLLLYLATTVTTTVDGQVNRM